MTDVEKLIRKCDYLREGLTHCIPDSVVRVSVVKDEELVYIYIGALPVKYEHRYDICDFIRADISQLFSFIMSDFIDEVINIYVDDCSYTTVKTFFANKEVKEEIG